MNSIDLTVRPPRSARVRIGGYVLLARMLDKGRAAANGRAGEFNFGCPLDRRFLDFVEVSADDVMLQIKAGKGDGEILEWIESNSKTKRAPWEIEAWSRFQENRVTTDCEARAFFNKLHLSAASKREDIATWFDLLDLDDYVTYGGQA